MADIITGVRTTFNINQDRRVIDIGDSIALLEPDSNPFTLILRKLGKQKAVNTEFGWLEDELAARSDKINNPTGYGPTDTELVVDNAVFFKPNQIVKVPSTGEEMLVTAVNEDTNTITVIRGYGTTAAGNLPDNTDLLILGTAFKENDTEGVIKTTKTVKLTNYTQIFKTPFGISRTQSQTEQYGEKDLPYLRRKMAIEHAVDIERTFLFGEKKEDVENSRRKTAGVLSFIQTNVVVDSDGILTETEFLDFLERVYHYNRIAKGSSKITLFASSLIVKAINFWAKGHLQVPNKSETYGISVIQYVHPFGSPLNIINHPLLSGPYSGYAIALNMELLKMRVIQDTILKTNIQPPNQDGIEEMYLTEAGLQMMQEKRVGLLKGVTGYS